MHQSLLLYSQPTPHPCLLYPLAEQQGILTNSPSEATHFLLPFSYEYTFGSQTDCFNSYGVSEEAYIHMQQLAKEYERLSVTYQKKLVVFFYHDSEAELPFSNAIVFRTSWRRSKHTQHVYGMPAFVDSLPQNPHPAPLPYHPIPSVSFRGQSAPLRQQTKTRIKFGINRLLRKLGWANKQLKIWWLAPYLYRRAAILSLLRMGKAICFDWAITQHHGAYAHPQKNDYLQAMAQHAYILCVAGFGNYSYRFYEALREARIPLFVDSDCLLPCEDIINWREHLVWIETQQLPQIGPMLLRFHQLCSSPEFENRQHHLQQLYNQYLTPEAFGRYVLNNLGKSI